MAQSKKIETSSEPPSDLIGTLRNRFEANMNRHEAIEWTKVQARLEANDEKLWSLGEMERTGGEPDVVGFDKTTGEYIFFDCSEESQQDLGSIAASAATRQL